MVHVPSRLEEVEQLSYAAWRESRVPGTGSTAPLAPVVEVETTFEDHASRFHKPAVLHWGWDVWAATIAMRYLKDGRHAYLMKVDAHVSSIPHVLHSRHLTLRIRATGFVEIGG